MQCALRGWGLMAALLGAAAAGCGSESDPGESFVGSWQYVSGTSTITCPPPLQPMNQTLAGMMAITRGSEVALEAAKPLGDGGQTCTIKLAVAGAVATATPDQTCQVTIMNIPATLQISSYSFAISGGAMTETGAGKGVATWSGLTFECDYTSTGQLMKVP